ncbi:MAG TPA: hypothetical protein VLH58_01815 [Candidatus Methylomirabilis sp.]|nr:hypothetical protein [Candidatus Methylomirabilis sp.]
MPEVAGHRSGGLHNGVLVAQAEPDQRRNAELLRESLAGLVRAEVPVGLRCARQAQDLEQSGDARWRPAVRSVGVEQFGRIPAREFIRHGRRAALEHVEPARKEIHDGRGGWRVVAGPGETNGAKQARRIDPQETIVHESAGREHTADAPFDDGAAPDL